MTESASFPIFNIQNECESISFELSNLKTIERSLEDNLSRLENLDSEIDRSTSKADNLDIWASIVSGLITGLIDIFFIGELKFDTVAGFNSEDSNSGNDIINNFVKKVASWTGYEGPDDLSKIIEHLENRFHLDCDDAYRVPGGNWVSSHTLHHLEDLCHHPTPGGFLAALCVSFFRIAIFSNKNGKTTFVQVGSGKGDLKKTIIYWAAIIVSGLLYWMSCALCRKYSNKELSELPKWQRILIKFGSSIPALSAIGHIAFNWAGHLISDMAGSNNTAGAGMGIPGIFISLMKEISMTPPFNSTNLPEVVQRLYSRQRIDFRDELIPVAKHLGKQSIPVILNELIVSTFYFVSRLNAEHKRNGGWDKINWVDVIPFFNRTIVRMRSISSGVFVAVDAAGACIETAIKGEGVDPSTFLIRMALKMNIVGVGKFVIDLGKDISMGFTKGKMKRIRSKVMMERVFLLGAKVYILKNNIWEEAQNIDKALDYLSQSADKAISVVCNNWKSVIEDFPDTNRKLLELRKRDSEINNTLNQYL
ncbi:MAG: hypothetical protein HDS99_01810 [Bacteroidales bacterium]|nr:hypothetical protein [Bacteroidales bacterium]